MITIIAIIEWINKEVLNVSLNSVMSFFAKSKFRKRYVDPAIVVFKKANMVTTPPTTL